MTQTPKSLGFRMPAEWERHEATWLAWPHDKNTWENPSEIEDTYVEIIKGMHTGEKVKLLVNDEKEEKGAQEKLKNAKVDLNQVVFYRVPNVDAWMRDCGPIFIINEKTKEKAYVHWEFNAWGNKYDDLLQDKVIPEKLSKFLKLKSFRPGIVLEGGSIDVNGKGICMTSEQCLLNKNRNPSLSRKEIEAYLKEFLGVDEILWLKEGIENDDTDGHIDDIARFVDEKTILCSKAPPDDPNHKALNENFEILKKDGRFKIIELPMPYYEHEGKILPATYANFLIANDCVLVPIFEHKNDKQALEILGKCFLSRKIIGINCRKLVFGGGTIHCRTQQEPRV
ncbi:MAG TPA: agmatine deiminase family protein [Candidatus Nanoarchaeia archaeon]|nr:agmatine deiminase family protein [Candidatus Nanoarchaeia archaeon]